MRALRFSTQLANIARSAGPRAGDILAVSASKPPGSISPLRSSGCWSVVKGANRVGFGAILALPVPKCSDSAPGFTVLVRRLSLSPPGSAAVPRDGESDRRRVGVRGLATASPCPSVCFVPDRNGFRPDPNLGIIP